MKNYIFDTNVFEFLINNQLPIKWNRYWQEIKNNAKNIILFEILITEIFYKLSKIYGFSSIESKIYQIKSLTSSIIAKINDNIALLAGKIRNKYQKNNLSIVDSYILAYSVHYHARIITTDSGIKKAGKDEKLEVDFIPFKEIA